MCELSNMWHRIKETHKKYFHGNIWEYRSVKNGIFLTTNCHKFSFCSNFLALLHKKNSELSQILSVNETRTVGNCTKY